MFKKAGHIDDLWSGEMKGIEIDGQKVLLINQDNVVQAFENRCVHQAVELSRGCFENGILICFAHHWQFDAKTGSGINPSETQIKVFATELRDGEIWVDVEQVLLERKGGKLGK